MAMEFQEIKHHLSESGIKYIEKEMGDGVFICIAEFTRRKEKARSIRLIIGLMDEGQVLFIKTHKLAGDLLKDIQLEQLDDLKQDIPKHIMEENYKLKIGKLSACFDDQGKIQLLAGSNILLADGKVTENQLQENISFVLSIANDVFDYVDDFINRYKKSREEILLQEILISLSSEKKTELIHLIGRSMERLANDPDLLLELHGLCLRNSFESEIRALLEGC